MSRLVRALTRLGGIVTATVLAASIQTTPIDGRVQSHIELYSLMLMLYQTISTAMTHTRYIIYAWGAIDGYGIYANWRVGLICTRLHYCWVTTLASSSDGISDFIQLFLHQQSRDASWSVLTPTFFDQLLNFEKRFLTRSVVLYVVVASRFYKVLRSDLRWKWGANLLLVHNVKCFCDCWLTYSKVLEVWEFSGK